MKKLPPVVYIAGPYRAKTAWGVEQHIRRAEEYALVVWKMGAAPWCTHPATRYFDKLLPDDVFVDGTMAQLLKCDAALFIPGWQNSEGSRGEMAECAKHGIPVFFVEPTAGAPGLEQLEQWVKRTK